MAGTKNKRTEAQKKKDQKRISELFVKGYSLRKMAEAISAERTKYTLSHVQVKYDLDKILDEWKTTTFKNIEDKQLIEIQKLNKVEFEAWNTFDETKSARFLEIVLKCIEKRCRIFGIEETPESYTERQIIVVTLPDLEGAEGASDESK
jgi:hypothetical protein